MLKIDETVPLTANSTTENNWVQYHILFPANDATPPQGYPHPPPQHFFRRYQFIQVWKEKTRYDTKTVALKHRLSYRKCDVLNTSPQHWHVILKQAKFTF